MTICMECGAEFDPAHRAGRLFCSTPHKQAYHNRQIKRGNKLYPLVYRWRALRSTNPEASNEAFSKMCSMLANWIDDDRRVNRACPSMPYLGVEGAVAFKPTTNQAAIAKADRVLTRDFAIARRNMRIRK